MNFAIRLFSIRILDAELPMLRWLVLNKLTTGKSVLPTILKIRQAREMIANV